MTCIEAILLEGRTGEGGRERGEDQRARRSLVDICTWMIFPVASHALHHSWQRTIVINGIAVLGCPFRTSVRRLEGQQLMLALFGAGTV